MTSIDFIYFDAGGGHRAAATALKAVCEQQQRPWNIRLVNLQEVLDSLDVFRQVTGIRLEDIYNRLLAAGWTIGSAQGLMLMHGVIRLYHGPTVKLLKEHWGRTRPAMVVSLVPNFNRAMYEGLTAVLPEVPYVTILTDFADFPPHFWMEPAQRQHFICGTDRAVEQGRALGHPAERLLRASGMILRPAFYQPGTVERDAERRKLALQPGEPTGVVLFGGQGSMAMLDIAKRLQDTQLIFICGRNESLARALRALPAKAPRFIEGFTTEVPYYMRLADYFIGKPGPGSISEAVAMGLPVMVERNSWTLAQERYNTEWVREKGVGIVLENFRDIGAAAARMERDLPAFRAAVGKIHNRAVFEIPEMLEQILAGPRP